MNFQTTLDIDFIKVVFVNEIYNFGVDKFLIWKYLESQIFILKFLDFEIHILKIFKQSQMEASPISKL